MKTRVTTGIIMICLAMIVLYCKGIVLLIVGTALLLSSQYEIIHAFKQRGIAPYSALIYFVGAFIGFAIYYLGKHLAIPILFAAIFIQSISILFIRDFVFDRLLVTLFCIVYPAVNYATLFVMLFGNQHSVALGLCAVFSAVGCDTFAWLVGKRYGKHKLCPKISPNKTIEGAVAGVFGSILAIVVLKAVLNLIQMDLSWSVVLAGGFVCAIATEAGDLFASLIKRFCAIKDFSTLLPGHGGIMDRLDGILFSSVALCYLNVLINML